MKNNQPVNAAPYMWIVGAIIIVVFLFYGLFIALDTLGLEKQQGQAEITAKHYQQPHQTYIVQHIGGRNITLPQSVEGAYILSLKLGTQETYAIVRKTQYDLSYIGQHINLFYQQSRLTKNIQVLDIEI